MRTLLLRIVHYLIALGELVHYLVILMPSHALNFAKKPILMSIESDSKTLRKRPSHIGLLIAEDQFSFRDIANIIVWSVSLGISYISVYDLNGEVKRNSVLLQRLIEESKEEVLGQDKSNFDIQLFSSSHPLEHPATGRSKTHCHRVHLLCMEEGQRNIISTTRHLSRLAGAGSYNIQDIQPSSIDTMIQEFMHFPDPEVCLKFGPVDCLLGYLPWQIRLTEIISVSSHLGLSYKSFLSSLVQYNSTSQRFGK